VVIVEGVTQVALDVVVDVERVDEPGHAGLVLTDVVCDCTHGPCSQGAGDLVLAQVLAVVLGHEKGRFRESVPVLVPGRSILGEVELELHLLTTILVAVFTGSH
jgi:hypothetical protein